MCEAVIVDAIRTPIGRAVKEKLGTLGLMTSPRFRCALSWNPIRGSISARRDDIMMLARDASSHIPGQIWGVNGGIDM